MKVWSPELLAITALRFSLNHFSVPLGIPRPSTPDTRHCIANGWPLFTAIRSLASPVLLPGISNLSGSGLSRMKFKKLYVNLKPLTLTRFRVDFVLILTATH